MQVIFSGVGESCDEYQSNTSLILIHENRENPHRPHQILMDCGFTAAHAFWRHSPDPLNLDVVWISHFHGDHFFGLPLLLLRSWEENRRKPLTIVGPPDIEVKVKAAMELAYPNFFPRIQYPIKFTQATPDTGYDIADLKWSFAANGHSQQCLAVKISSPEKSIFYSGDGRPTPGSKALALGCDLIVHEAFTITTLQGGHGTVQGCIQFARKAGAPVLALIHVNRDVRNQQSARLKRTIGEVTDLTVLLPASGDQVTV